MNRARTSCTVPRNAFWWWLSKSALHVYCLLWHRLRIENREAVPGTGPVLLVANHTSYLDPPLIGIGCRRWVGYLAQAGLAKFAPLRWWLRQVGVTLIDRNAPSKDALRLLAGCLAAGEVVGLFPEGTRSRDGAVGEFRSGVEFLVRRTGATVVPIGIDGAFRAFPRGRWLPRPTRIVVRHGEPWPAERVLAPGGISALRARVAELARAPLRENRPLPVADAAGSRETSSADTGAKAPGAANRRPDGPAPGL
jgi:1-acyl-sn-glycerol-3-phosphate acyltransferase